MSRTLLRASLAYAAVCSSGATERSWLETVARRRVPRSELSAVDMADGLGTKRTRVTSPMSPSATESSGPRAAMTAEIAARCTKGVQGPKKSKIPQITLSLLTLSLLSVLILSLLMLSFFMLLAC